MKNDYQALMVVSFGGPEGPADVLPFLENVLRGRNVPRERLLEVAEHYYQFGGKSPLNDQIRTLIAALKVELEAHAIRLPIYWGNRNWHPLLTDTMKQMADDGVTKALALATSAFSCYSGCRQYREDIWQARMSLGMQAPEVHKLRVFYDHPRFIAAMIDRVQSALSDIPRSRWATTQLVFTAHSIPSAMADSCRYVQQLRDASGWVAAAFPDHPWQLVFQSRSGPPAQPWLEPDVLDYLRELAKSRGATDVVLVPIGFLSDHMEVKFDLDTQARQVGEEVGLGMVRSATAGTHPEFVGMIRELVQEQLDNGPRIGLATEAACRGLCSVECCWPGRPGFVPHEQRMQETRPAEPEIG